MRAKTKATDVQSGHNAQLFTGLRDQSNLLVADFFIDLMSISSDGKAPPNKKIDGTPIRLPHILKKHYERKQFTMEFLEC